jgi:hypothetical protein
VQVHHGDDPDSIPADHVDYRVWKLKTQAAARWRVELAKLFGVCAGQLDEALNFGIKSVAQRGIDSVIPPRGVLVFLQSRRVKKLGHEIM